MTQLVAVEFSDTVAECSSTLTELCTVGNNSLKGNHCGVDSDPGTLLSRPGRVAETRGSIFVHVATVHV